MLETGFIFECNGKCGDDIQHFAESNQIQKNPEMEMSAQTSRWMSTLSDLWEASTKGSGKGGLDVANLQVIGHRPQGTVYGHWTHVTCGGSEVSHLRFASLCF